MVNLTQKEFEDKKSLNVIFPMFIKINGDELTPVNIYYKLKGKYKFLLESASSSKEESRYSFLGSSPYMILSSYGKNITITKENEVKNKTGKILDFAEGHLLKQYDRNGLELPFIGGAIGYIAYDVVRQYENLPDNNPDELNLPETCLLFYKEFICFDHFKNTLMLIHNVFPEEDEDYDIVLNKLNIMKSMVSCENVHHKLIENSQNKELISNYKKEDFCKLVNKAKDYITSGDIFQVVLSQRFKVENSIDPFEVYRKLRRSNPSPYMFYIDFEDFKLAGASPESLVKVKGNVVMTNPIAGSRPRGKTAKEDELLKEELLNDEKELAEHLMLVDLGRNDIGKISEFGSVKLDKFMEVEAFSHIMHICSKVSGTLKNELNCFDALKSCLPVGTVSGAPKIRAMEIIDELENTRRGIYSGAIGYFSYGGDMDTCIAIRTIVFKDNFAYVQGGAGIVYDSVPETEYTETLNKTMALMEVL
ncbi:anthranilate synthase component I [Clostridium estertheticum]|uniref:anthranilate synthase component I n=1 Tax=Clostridium estertheticum TaxID=238834 RepID=UPI001CF26291|nr:anthranilate synthase component I [Clostridium estertheticum]MCB2306975.1 anthranilate synthase component I [Clostridium estertheticum]MCB2345236.1 anthranilate synthase component I [Clostridium estertheticum]MCB2350481.1 anthranilate synthase component I [Clostridium estertheticum]WAG45132.1 anthranilate synthase component I [Clostridium estertheticum]